MKAVMQRKQNDVLFGVRCRRTQAMALFATMFIQTNK